MRTLILAGLLLLGAGCERPSERGARERELAARVILEGLTVPGSTVVSYGAGDEAAEVVLTTGLAPAQVVAWYREAMRLNNWELRQESRAPDGSVTLYAESRDGRRPLWVRVRPNAGAAGTTYSVIGAEVARDTLK
ncbi:MAG TPA: hypothetical protein VNI61_05990 [Gemmatimonadales bacterium]|nr:hypothetical protein [Gemmatimonadales bacterium]